MENKPGRGRGRGRPCSQGFRGRARGGDDLISCGPRRPRQSVPRARTINPRNSDAIVDWITQNSSSSSSASARYPDLTPSFSDSATPQVKLLTSQSAAAAAAATTTTTSREAPLDDLSEELFQHDITADAQHFFVEDEGAKNVTPPHMSQLHVNTPMDMRCEEDLDEVPGVGAVLEVSDTSEAVDDDEGMDVTWQWPRGRDEQGGSSEEEETECVRRRKRTRQIDARSRGSSSKNTRGTVRPHDGAPRVSQQTRPSKPAVVDTPTMPGFKSSAVWHFFSLCASDSSKAICKLCQKKLSRGKVTGHLGTTVLKNHLVKKHEQQWNEHVRRSSTLAQSHTPPRPTPEPGPPASSTCTSLAPSQPPSSTLPLTFSSSCSSAHSHSQPSVVEMFERKKPMSPSNPLAQRLTAGLAELLARQLLPYQLVDSEAFKNFVAIGTPQWKIPGRNYFSKKAIPKLYKEVERQVVSSMSHSVGARVHLTTDGWSAKHGQGRYMTYTAHWVNLLATTGKHGARACTVEMVPPPRLAGRSADTSSSPPPPPSSSQLTSSDSYSDTAALSSLSAQPQLRRAYSACKAQRCHAILDMSCLKAESHTGQALLDALQEQVEQWLTPHQLEIGRVVSDNASNLLSALSLGNLTHVPCMAHVLNLIVQRFVSKYPGLQDVLKQSRKVCGHLRRSYTAMQRFTKIQRRNKLPVRRLICDSPTRWNSTLLMFDRLLQQEKAVNAYLYSYGGRTGSAELGIFLPRYWTLMRNACRLMRPFEEVTNLVSRSEGSISDIIPYVFLLERAVRRLVDQAVEEREEEEELWAPSPPNTELTSTPALLDAAQRDEEEEESWEEDSEEEDGFEEEIGEQPQQSTQGACAAPLSGTRRGIVRGWGPVGEEENLPDITQREEEAMASSTSNLVQMGSFMLSSLLRDPRIKSMKNKDLYWVATLLDPRYKHKVPEMLPHSQKAERMEKLHKTLSTLLYNAFKGDATAQERGVSKRPPPPPFSTQARTGSSSDIMVMSDMQTFFSPTTRLGPSGSTLRQRLDCQVADYLALTADIDTVSSSDEPLDYWVRRLDLWPELSQYAMELLACPASSVLSERTFSAAGGIVTEKRSRLGQKSVKYLTFIKMNEAWIPKGYSLPKEDF